MEFVEITDPQTGKLFFANISTGECTWDKPSDSKVKLKNPEQDEWWELFDENHKLPYYYNTKTQETEWLRPSEGMIIPLIAIQNSSIGKRVSVAIKRASQMQSFGSLPDINPTSKTEQKQYSPEKEKFSSSRLQYASKSNNSSPSSSPRSQRSARNNALSPTQPLSNVNNSNHKLSSSLPDDLLSEANADSLGYESLSISPSPKGHKKNNSTSSESRGRGKKHNSYSNSQQNQNQQQNFYNKNQIPIRQPEFLDEYNEDSFLKPRPTSESGNSVGGRPSSRVSLPADLIKQLEEFRIEGYAQTYFSEHRRGIFRRRVPLDKMLNFQKESLKSPLLVLNKPLHKEALKCFKFIQRAMGDKNPKDHEFFNDLKNLADLGIAQGGLRDEIYVQQLTNNPNGGTYGNSVFRGWQILIVLSLAFPPSKNLEDYIKQFIRKNFNSPMQLESPLIPKDTRLPLDQMARYLLKKIEKICKFGAKGKPMTYAEIERACEAPFRASVFGESLEDVMKSELEWFRKHGKGERSEIPRVLPFLADAVLNLNGSKSEGIFRVPGDIEGVTELRCRIEKGEYVLGGITDPNIPSSLLKLWLRELSEPLIPVKLYDICIEVGSGENTQENFTKALKVLKSLPEINRKVLEYTIRFLKIVGDPSNVSVTKMNHNNIAMVFAPNFLRCPSDNPAVIFENTKFEQGFLRLLITHL